MTISLGLWTFPVLLTAIAAVHCAVRESVSDYGFDGTQLTWFWVVLTAWTTFGLSFVFGG